MNKFQFITHLMDNRKFTPSQKERFLKLASKEFGLVKPSNEELWEEIKKIKEKLGDNEVVEKMKTIVVYDPDGNPDEIEVPHDYEYEQIDLVALLGEEAYNEVMKAVDVEDLKSKMEKIDSNIPEVESKKYLSSRFKAVKKPLTQSADLKGNEGVEKIDDSSNAIISTAKFSSPSLSNKKRFHDPKKVNEWLQYFTKDNTAIKFSTHPWDDDLYTTYEDYIGELNDEYIKYDFHSLQKYSVDLYWNKINPFLFQRKLTKLEISGKKPFGWGRYKVGIGWQYPNLIKSFCEQNFDNKGIMATTPLTMELPDEIVPIIPGKTIKTFEDAVAIFKQEIEFRVNSLWVGVKTELKRNLPNHSIDETHLNSLKGCTFYTNTEYVLKAISRIFKMIKSRSESQNVQISCSFSDETQQYILEILHLNSFSDMHIHHPKLIAEERGDLSILRTTLLSLCDFSVESRFKDATGNIINARIDYLYDDVEAKDWKPNIVTDIENPGGFKFILKFLV